MCLIFKTKNLLYINNNMTFSIGDKVKIIGGTHHKKKGPQKWGYVKSQTKTYCKIDYHHFIESKERGDAEDEVIIKELQVAAKFLEKVPDLIVEMPTADDLVVVDKLKDMPDLIEGDKEVAVDDNIEINITEKEAEDFDKEGMRILEEEDVWGGDDDEPMTFEELNNENEDNKAMVLNLQNQVKLLQDELSKVIANMRGSGGDGLLEENMQLKILLKMYL